LLNALPAVKDSFVWGYKASDGDVEICAKIVLNKEYMEENNYSIEEIADILEQQIRDINSNIPKYKIIRYFVMTFEDLVKTTTLKIKRHIEEEKMRNYIQKSGVEMRQLQKKFID